MAVWRPKINVFDERSAKSALIAYFKTNQADALAWANDGAALPLIEKFHKQTAYVAGKFPFLVFNRTSHSSQFEDILTIKFAVELEVWLMHGKPDILSDYAVKYSMALESMLVNVPDATFSENSKIRITVEADRMETAFDLQGKLNKGGFIQIFQTSAQWTIEASAYGD